MDKTPVVLITGASSGIGAELAREFSRRRFSVAICARRAERLKTLAEELERGGRRVFWQTCDVRTSEVEKFASAVVEHFGRIDLVIVNAGFGVSGYFEKLELSDFQNQFDINVWGAIRTIKATMDELKRTSGKLCLIGSIASYMALPSSSAYSMSKAAVTLLAEALYYEMAPHGVTVTLVSPGFIQSEIRRVNNRGEFKSGARDPVPHWLQMPAAVAARKIANGVLRGRREVVLTVHGKILVCMKRLFPWFFCWLVRKMGVTARPEPKSGGD